MNNASHEYHLWYYNKSVWQGVKFLDVPTYKSVSDMWNYQEILSIIKPSLIVEFGTRFGGATLYFSVIGKAIRSSVKVLSVDINHADVHPQVHKDPAIELMTSSSIEACVSLRIAELRKDCVGPMFVILDSDHRCNHVLAEMELLRGITQTGDYVVVEDGNVNGHPVLPGWGEGPFEALSLYASKYPNDYEHDSVRENKFGFTFAPNGFLIRR